MQSSYFIFLALFGDEYFLHIGPLVFTQVSSDSVQISYDTRKCS